MKESVIEQIVSFPALVLSLLASKALSVEGIVSHRFPFDQVVEALSFASEHRGEVGKVVIG
ncbi:hypothetical protein [uncultured Sphaerochaeta sp.]|uniref:hypothetical protein n=1 Tax=uncultured Sphaerochaeta sp. TaxID=886478 RepID=UPI0029CA9A09|nr:hypothetical protein [uncultured Sphaerochaeta sp.]